MRSHTERETVNKRIRKKWAHKYGRCPKCASADTGAVAPLMYRGGRWIERFPIEGVLCFVCGHGLTKKQLDDYRRTLAARRST